MPKHSELIILIHINNPTLEIELQGTAPARLTLRALQSRFSGHDPHMFLLAPLATNSAGIQQIKHADTMIATPQIASSPQDAFSDYGSDWDEELVNELYDRTSNSGLDAAPALIVTDIEDYEEPRGVRLPKILGCDSWAPSLSQDFSTSHQPLGQQTTLRDDDLVETGTFSPRSPYVPTDMLISAQLKALKKKNDCES